MVAVQLGALVKALAAAAAAVLVDWEPPQRMAQPTLAAVEVVVAWAALAASLLGLVGLV